MDDESRSGAYRKAWYVGGAVGVAAGVLTAATGLMAGMCCLLQFGNVIIPAIAGVVGGGVAASMVPWATFGPGTASGLGLAVGLRGGGTAAAVSALVGFLLSLLYPILSMGIIAVAGLTSGSGEEMIASLIGGIIGLGTSALFALMFSVAGALVGIALAAGTGAAVEATSAPKV